MRTEYKKMQKNSLRDDLLEIEQVENEVQFQAMVTNLTR